MKRVGPLRILGKVWQFFIASKSDRPTVRELEKGKISGPASRKFPMPLSCIGFCEPPNAPNKRIILREGLPFKLYFDTFIHENIHAGDYAVSEEWVDEFSSDLTRNILKYFDVSPKEH